MTLTPNQDPHGAQSVLIEGHDLEDANGVVILLHGRGSPAVNIIRLSQPLAPDPESEQQIAWLAPQADNNSWYPYRFMVPVEQNEPYLSSALKKIDDLVDSAVEAGLHSKQVMLVGFSQGACLALEYIGPGNAPDRGCGGLRRRFDRRSSCGSPADTRSRRRAGLHWLRRPR